MLVRLSILLAALLLSLSTAHAADGWEPRALTDAERAVVLEKLDGYSDEDRDYILGRLDGSIAPESAGGGKSYDDNASILAFGSSSERGRHIERVITEIEYTISDSCPDGAVRVERQCKWDREGRLTYSQKFYNHYYRGCTDGRYFGRCDD